MRTHRAARFVAILLFVVAAVYFGGGLFAGLSLWTRGLGEGWGSGFAGWISIPILLGAFFGATVLLLFGTILYFLARIDANLSDARERMRALKERPARASAVTPRVAEPHVPPVQAPVPAEPIIVAPAVIAAAAGMPKVKTEGEIKLPKVELPAVAAELPKVDIAAPRIEAPKVELPKVDIAAPQVEAPQVELPKVDIAAPHIEAPKVDIVAPAVELPQVKAELPEVKAEAPKVELPKVEIARAVAPAAKRSRLDAFVSGIGRLVFGSGPDQRPKTEAARPPAAAQPMAESASAKIAAEKLEAELPKIDDDAEPKEFSGKLPGLEEAARIASEMAASEEPSLPKD